MKVSLLLFVLASSMHVAPAPDADFTWKAPAQVCPDVGQAQARLEQLQTSQLGSVRAQAEVEESRDGFELRLVMIAGAVRSERVLRAADCETLFDAALFSFSLALAREAELAQSEDRIPTPDETDAAPESPQPEPQPEAPAIDDPVSSLQEERASTSPSPSERDRKRGRGRVGFGLKAHGGVANGPLGGPTAPLGGSVGLGGERWRWELGGLAYTPRSVSSTVDPSAGARLSAWSIRTRGCGVIPLSARWVLPLCGQVEGGLTRASGFGVDAPQRPRAAHLMVGPGVGLGWVVHSRVRLCADLGASLALARPAFVIDGAAGDLFVSPLANFSAELGVEFRFGPG